MPLLATGFEAADFSYYESLGFITFGTVTVSQRYVHRSYGYGGRWSLRLEDDLIAPHMGKTCRWCHVWVNPGEFLGSMGITFNGDAQNHVTVRVVSDGSIQIRRNGYNGTLLATSAGNLDLSNGQGYWLAIELVVANSGGACNVYIGDEALAFVSYTGDTKGSNGVTYDGWDTILFSTAGGNFYVDDFVVTDSAEGRVNETYGFGRRVRSDQGVAFVPSAGADNWKNVTVYDETSYNQSGGSLVQDLYGIDGNLELGQISFVVAQGVIGGVNGYHGSLVVKSGATTTTGPLFGGANAYNGELFHLLNDPDTAAAWTQAAALAVQVGVRTQA